MPFETADASPAGERRLHHITRIDIEPSEEHPRRHPTHGWQVRARRDGKRLSKFFADAKHDSREAALEAAFAYRDQLLASLPTEPTKPRKAWSNTGVVGLSVREKEDGERPKLYVQLNWINASGKRRAASYSVEKWGLRRALWNGCLKLYRERSEAGYPVEEPHVMFARSQEPFADRIREEVEAEEAERQVTERAEADAREAEEARARAATPEAEMAREEATIRQLEDALFG